MCREQCYENYYALKIRRFNSSNRTTKSLTVRVARPVHKLADLLKY